jgi:hypothetical protein
MHSQTASSKLKLIERRILCALCGGTAGSDADSIPELRKHRWEDPEHRIVFEALSKLPPCDAKALREMLPSQATRMGFPDVGWQRYFDLPAKLPQEIKSLVSELLKTAAQK